MEVLGQDMQTTPTKSKGGNLNIHQKEKFYLIFFILISMALLLFLYSLHSQYFFPLALVQTSISSRYLMTVHQPDKLKKKICQLII